MKAELTTMVDKLQNWVKWTLGICVGFIVLLVVGITVFQTKQAALSEMVMKINYDYAPLIVIQDIAKDNRNLIKIIQMLPETTKDDPRYLNAITESESFQNEALRRAAGAKRGGTE